MADVKISQLPAATTPVDGTEVLPIVQSATTKQVSIANLTAGRAMSASSLTLTTPLAVTSGGTGISTTGAGTFVVSATADTISATATPTLGVQQTTQGTLTLANTAAGAWPVTLQSSNSATAAWTMTLPTAPAAANGYILTSNTTGVTSWSNPTALGIDLDVGTTAITGGTTTRVLYNNAGVLGEYAVTGTGSVVLGTTPTFTTSALFPAGTVSAPGISVSGDTNTGIYFPAADTIGFVEGGVEAMRITSAGTVNIVGAGTAGSTQAVSLNGSAPINSMVLDASGNLGIGTSSPSARLDVQGGSLRVNEDGAGTKIITLRSNYASIGPAINVTTNDPLLFLTNNTERARISSDGTFRVKGAGTAGSTDAFLVDGAAPASAARINSGGALLVGTTSEITGNGNTRLAVKSSGATSTTRTLSQNVCIASNGSGADCTIQFTDSVSTNYYFGGYNGTAYVTTDNNQGVKLAGGATSWAADSDERLKDINGPILNAIDKLKTLRTVEGRYKTDEDSVNRLFLIAQDVQKVYPEAIDIENGEEGILLLRYSELIPPVIAAIKELAAKVTALEEQLNA